MDLQVAFKVADKIAVSAGYQPQNLEPKNILQYTALIRDIIKFQWTAAQRENTWWLKEFLLTIARIEGEYGQIVAKDPMVQYRPKHEVSEQFHSSLAFIRYYRAGNRTSKTQSGYAEHYFFTTGQHPFQDVPAPPSNTFILAGLPYSVYSNKVFEAKFISGEPENPLAPIFPVGGKWLHRYDSRSKTISIACKSCAELGRAGDCPHPKSSIFLFSSEQNVGVLEAFSGRMGHIDEHVPKKFFTASRMRLMDNPGARFIVTGTPLHGLLAWEKKDLADVALGSPDENLFNPEDPTSIPMVSIHQISQYDAGIATKERIDAEARSMDEFEREARIEGIPAPLADKPVFNRAKLYEIKQQYVREPEYVTLHVNAAYDDEDTAIVDLLNIQYDDDVIYEKDTPGTIETHTGWRIWEFPDPDSKYVACADTAAGLHDRDASCCSILKVTADPSGYPKSELVAQFHGWAELFDYADEIKKGAVFYNNALVIVETTGGYGRAVLLRLKEQTQYWNLFLDRRKAEQLQVGIGSQHGVDTNKESKPLMIGSTQTAINKDLLIIPCTYTINEFLAYGQEETDSGLSVRYRGMGEKDDRVMSICAGEYALMTSQSAFWQLQTAQKRSKEDQKIIDGYRQANKNRVS